MYTLRDVMEEDFVGTLKKVAEIGYEGVEICRLWGIVSSGAERGTGRDRTQELMFDALFRATPVLGPSERSAQTSRRFTADSGSRQG